MNISETITKKLTSGRFWLAIMSGAALLILILTKQVLSGEVLPIITLVFMNYFSKSGGGGSGSAVGE